MKTELFTILGLFAFLPSCAVEMAEGEESAEKEAIAETREAEEVTVEAIGRPEDELRLVNLDLLTPEESRKLIEESLVGWEVYLDTRAVDHGGQLVAVRARDRNESKSWIRLDLRQHQMAGDGYLQQVMRQHHLTVLDMAGILLAIERTGGKPPIHLRRPISHPSSTPAASSAPPRKGSRGPRRPCPATTTEVVRLQAPARLRPPVVGTPAVLLPVSRTPPPRRPGRQPRRRHSSGG